MCGGPPAGAPWRWRAGRVSACPCCAGGGRRRSAAAAARTPTAPPWQPRAAACCPGHTDGTRGGQIVTDRDKNSRLFHRLETATPHTRNYKTTGCGGEKLQDMSYSDVLLLQHGVAAGVEDEGHAALVPRQCRRVQTRRTLHVQRVHARAVLQQQLHKSNRPEDRTTTSYKYSSGRGCVSSSLSQNLSASQSAYTHLDDAVVAAS